RFRGPVLIATAAAALMVPVGFVLSLEAMRPAAPAMRPAAPHDESVARVVNAPVASTPVALAPMSGRATSPPQGTTTSGPVPRCGEGARPFAIGTVLFALAAAVRRAV